MVDHATRAMVSQYRKAIKKPCPYIKYWLDDKDTRTVYLLLTNFPGDKGEFTYTETTNGVEKQRYGEYLVKMSVNDNFPHEPPRFHLLTKNGLYNIDTPVCISIGEFHKSDYRPVLGIEMFAANLISGLIGWREMGGGIQITKTTTAEKQNYARLSRSYNREHYSEIIDNINNNFEEYSKKWSANDITPQIRDLFNLQQTVQEPEPEPESKAPPPPVLIGSRGLNAL